MRNKIIWIALQSQLLLRNAIFEMICVTSNKVYIFDLLTDQSINCFEPTTISIDESQQNNTNTFYDLNDLKHINANETNSIITATCFDKECKRIFVIIRFQYLISAPAHFWTRFILEIIVWTTVILWPLQIWLHCTTQKTAAIIRFRFWNKKIINTKSLRLHLTKGMNYYWKYIWRGRR